MALCPWGEGPGTEPQQTVSFMTSSSRRSCHSGPISCAHNDLACHFHVDGLLPFLYGIWKVFSTPTWEDLKSGL